MLHPRGTVTREYPTRVREEDSGKGLEGAGFVAVQAGLPESRVVAPKEVERVHEFLLGGVRPPPPQSSWCTRLTRPGSR